MSRFVLNFTRFTQKDRQILTLLPVSLFNGITKKSFFSLCMETWSKPTTNKTCSLSRFKSHINFFFRCVGDCVRGQYTCFAFVPKMFEHFVLFSAKYKLKSSNNAAHWELMPRIKTHTHIYILNGERKRICRNSWEFCLSKASIFFRHSSGFDVYSDAALVFVMLFLYRISFVRCSSESLASDVVSVCPFAQVCAFKIWLF